MQVVIAKPEATMGSAKVKLQHLGDRLLLLAKLESGDFAEVKLQLKGPAEGEVRVQVSKAKPVGGAFIKLPQGRYDVALYVNGEQALTGQVSAYPYDPSSPLLPAVLLAVLGLLAVG